MIKALSRIGSLLKRSTDGASSRSHPSQYLLALSLFITVGVTAAFSLAKPLRQLVVSSTDIRPEIEIPRNRWKVYFPEPNKVAPPFTQSSDLIPQSQLDASNLRLSDSDIFEKASLPEHRKFWVGTTIGTEEISSAVNLQAFIYAIGHINASHRIYINGQFTFWGDGRDYMYTLVDLTEALSKRPNVLHIAVLVSQDLSSARPFVVGAPIASGLFSRGNAKRLRDDFVVRSVAHQLVASTIALMATVVFFAMWASSRDRVELLLFSGFALCLAVNQFGSIGYFKFDMNRIHSYRFDLMIRICSGTLAAMIGVSFSRTKETVNWIIAMIAVTIAVSAANASSGAQILLFDSLAGTYFVPACYFFSSFVSACQAALLKLSSNFERQQEIWRRRQLWMFSMLNLCLSAFSLFSSKAILSIDTFSPFHMSSQLLIVLLLGLFLVVNHRRQLEYLKTAAVRAEIAAQVAHDIRAPIAVIETQLDLKNKFDVDAHIKGALNRIKSISNDLLQSERNQERAQAIQFVPLESVIEIVSKVALEKKVTHKSLEIEILPRTSTSFTLIKTVPETLARCISNILDNSIEAPSTNAKKILIEVKENKSSATLIVSDNGNGIPPPILKLIGSRGFSFGKDRNGFGFGLFFVKQCTKRWGAEFQIQSMENAGTSVSITFEADRVTHGDNTQFVLLDNDHGMISLWVAAGRRSGVKLLCFESFDKLTNALEGLTKSTVFFLDSDLGPGSPSGIEVAERLHSQGFKNIYLATGSPKSSFVRVKWIKAVVGKEPPWIG